MSENSQFELHVREAQSSFRPNMKRCVVWSIAICAPTSRYLHDTTADGHKDGWMIRGATDY